MLLEGGVVMEVVGKALYFEEEGAGNGGSNVWMGGPVVLWE